MDITRRLMNMWIPAGLVRLFRTTLLVAIVLSVASSAMAASFHFSPDVPTDLADTTHLPWHVVRDDGGTNTLDLALPDGLSIDAAHHMDCGDWLFSVEAPSNLEGTTYRPEDVVRFDGSSYEMAFDGSGGGIPAGVDVDAVFLDAGDTGDLILSFDVPTTIAGSTFEPADLVRVSAGAFSLFLDASEAGPGIPATSNVTGADGRGTLIIVTFDEPTTLGGSTYLPGELVSWDGANFESYFSDATWPISSGLCALTFLADPGSVPATIQLSKSSVTPGDLTISWSRSCSFGAEDYAIYEGTVGSWYSHTQTDCFDDGGDLTEEITPSSGNRYYLVVPQNPNDEGSYGTDSGGAERPVGTAACVATQALGPCPD